MSSVRTNSITIPKQTYVIVNFGKNPNDDSKFEVELALSSWLFIEDNELFCKFPSNKTVEQLEKYLENKTSAKKNWEKYAYEIVCSAGT